MTSPSLTVVYRAMWSTIMDDPGVTKFALGCATVVVGMVLATFGTIVALGGDVAALSIGIGGVLSTLIGSVASLMRRKKGGGDA